MRRSPWPQTVSTTSHLMEFLLYPLVNPIFFNTENERPFCVTRVPKFSSRGEELPALQRRYLEYLPGRHSVTNTSLCLRISAKSLFHTHGKYGKYGIDGMM